MLRLVLLLLVVAGVAGYFTKPDEPAMRAAAEQVLNDPQNISEGFETIGAAFAGTNAYSDYYVASKYLVTLGDRPLVECWGAFTQTQCNRVEATAGSAVKRSKDRYCMADHLPRRAPGWLLFVAGIIVGAVGMLLLITSWVRGLG